MHLSAIDSMHLPCCGGAVWVRAEGDGLDLLSYVEFQSNYMACVRAHKAALTAQRTFWNAVLRDPISFKDLQVWGRMQSHRRHAAVS
jgi:hypothetical protein